MDPLTNLMSSVRTLKIANAAPCSKMSLDHVVTYASFMVILQAVQLRVPPTPIPLHRDQTRLSRLTAECVQLCALCRALRQQSPGGSSETVQWGNENLKGGPVCSGVDRDPRGTQLQTEFQRAVWPGREGEKRK